MMQQCGIRRSQIKLLTFPTTIALSFSPPSFLQKSLTKINYFFLNPPLVISEWPITQFQDFDQISFFPPIYHFINMFVLPSPSFAQATFSPPQISLKTSLPQFQSQLALSLRHSSSNMSPYSNKWSSLIIFPALPSFPFLHHLKLNPNNHLNSLLSHHFLKQFQPHVIRIKQYRTTIRNNPTKGHLSHIRKSLFPLCSMQKSVKSFGSTFSLILDLVKSEDCIV